MGLRILLGLLLLFLFTQIQIGVSLLEVNIPITGQSFAVLLIPYIFGLKEGIVTILLYLIIGALGIPVFSDGGNGIEAFTGNSGGYLIGFLLGGWLSGYVSDNFRNTILIAFVAMFIGTLLIMMGGVIKLTFDMSISKAITYGFIPFISGGIIKVLLGTIAGWWIKKHIMPLNFKWI